eukprot:6176432-Pleurochrysis_carterae.AAC.4
MRRLQERVRSCGYAAEGGRRGEEIWAGEREFSEILIAEEWITGCGEVGGVWGRQGMRGEGAGKVRFEIVALA